MWDASLRVGDFCSRERPKRDRRRSEQGGGRLWESRSFWRSLRLFRPFTVVIAASRCGLARGQVAFCGSKGGRLWEGRWPSMGKKVAGYAEDAGGRLWDAPGQVASYGMTCRPDSGRGPMRSRRKHRRRDRTGQRWPSVGCPSPRRRQGSPLAVRCEKVAVWDAPAKGGRLWDGRVPGTQRVSGSTRAGGGRLWDSQTIMPVFRKSI